MKIEAFLLICWQTVAPMPEQIQRRSARSDMQRSARTMRAQRRRSETVAWHACKSVKRMRALPCCERWRGVLL